MILSLEMVTSLMFSFAFIGVFAGPWSWLFHLFPMLSSFSLRFSLHDYVGVNPMPSTPC
jgi:hypothetical protein